MVDIQSATAEISRKKDRKKEGERKKKKPQDENIMSAFATHGGHNDLRLVHITRIDLN